MLVLKVIRITEDLVSGALALPLSVTDYINQKKGNARTERAVGMLLLKQTLRELGVGSYGVETLPTGKPMLTGAPYYFSVSHSGGLCALALSDLPVGIDLQNLSAFDLIPDTERFAKRFLASDERKAFLQEPTREQLCRLWTRKEALAKLLGRTLNTSLSSLSSFGFDGVEFECRRAELDGDSFFLTVARPKDGNSIKQTE